MRLNEIILAELFAKIRCSENQKGPARLRGEKNWILPLCQSWNQLETVWETQAAFLHLDLI